MHSIAIFCRGSAGGPLLTARRTLLAGDRVARVPSVYFAAAVEVAAQTIHSTGTAARVSGRKQKFRPLVSRALERLARRSGLIPVLLKRFRPELISRASRLQPTDSRGLMRFRPELVSRAARLAGEWEAVTPGFRPELISRASSLKPYGGCPCNLFRPALISRASRLRSKRLPLTPMFRPELISRASRLTYYANEWMQLFRPELISRASRLRPTDSRGLMRFRPELISRASRLRHRGAG